MMILGAFWQPTPPHPLNGKHVIRRCESCCSFQGGWFFSLVNERAAILRCSAALAASSRHIFIDVDGCKILVFLPNDREGCRRDLDAYRRYRSMARSVIRLRFQMIIKQLPGGARRCASVSFERHAANVFQSYVQSALAFSIKRGGILYGQVDDEGLFAFAFEFCLAKKPKAETVRVPELLKMPQSVVDPPRT